MITCQKCQTKNPPDAEVCSQCKANLLPGTTLAGRLAGVLIGLVLGAIGYGLLYWISGVQPLSLICLGIFALGGLFSAFHTAPIADSYLGRALRHVELDPEQALMDINQAVQLSKDSERPKMLEQRKQIYAKLGLSEDGKSLPAGAAIPEQTGSAALAADAARLEQLAQAANTQLEHQEKGEVFRTACEMFSPLFLDFAAGERVVRANQEIGLRFVLTDRRIMFLTGGDYYGSSSNIGVSHFYQLVELSDVDNWYLEKPAFQDAYLEVEFKDDHSLKFEGNQSAVKSMESLDEGLTEVVNDAPPLVRFPEGESILFRGPSFMSLDTDGDAYGSTSFGFSNFGKKVFWQSNPTALVITDQRIVFYRVNPLLQYKGTGGGLQATFGAPSLMILNIPLSSIEHVLLPGEKWLQSKVASLMLRGRVGGGIQAGLSMPRSEQVNAEWLGKEDKPWRLTLCDQISLDHGVQQALTQAGIELRKS